VIQIRPEATSSVAKIAVGSLVAVVFLTDSAYLLDRFTEWNRGAVAYNATCPFAFSAFGMLANAKLPEVNFAVPYKVVTPL
jgi:hypothetical protein